MTADDPGARLHDAVMSAAARDRTFDETGNWRDNLKALLAIAKVAWRVWRTEKRQDDGDADRRRTP
jgi:hypothetical protein